MTRWPDDQMTIWPHYHITLFTRWLFLPNDQMTILTRWPGDQMTRWHADQMTILTRYSDQWPMTILSRWQTPHKASTEPPKILPDTRYMMIWSHWCIKTSSKTTVTNCPVKCDQSPQNWQVISHTRYNDDIWWSDHTDVYKHHQKQQ